MSMDLINKVMGAFLPPIQNPCSFLTNRLTTESYIQDPNQSHADPRISPLLVPSLKGLPPAFIQISGQDPLRDEAFVFERLLKEAGVPVKVEMYVLHLRLIFFSFLVHGRSRTLVTRVSLMASIWLFLSSRRAGSGLWMQKVPSSGSSSNLGRSSVEAETVNSGW
jgi:acetyl esterase/lipase